jgi:hypothetical protein
MKMKVFFWILLLSVACSSINCEDTTSSDPLTSLLSDTSEESTATVGSTDPGTSEKSISSVGSTDPETFEESTASVGSTDPETSEESTASVGFSDPETSEESTATVSSTDPDTYEESTATVGSTDPETSEESTASVGSTDPETSEESTATVGSTDPGTFEESTASSEPSTIPETIVLIANDSMTTTTVALETAINDTKTDQLLTASTEKPEPSSFFSATTITIFLGVLVAFSFLAYFACTSILMKRNSFDVNQC